MRMSVAQAKKAGVWAKVSAGDRKDILAKQKAHQHKTQNPQTILFNAVKRHIQEAQSEVKGLIPGRRFRADIYIPSSRIVIEFDGFKYHALHKHGFHKTLERQNLFVKAGYTVLRYYYKQVGSELDAVLAEIIETHNLNLKALHGKGVRQIALENVLEKETSLCSSEKNSVN
jgi:very-short-patch-repair endonuclease